MNIYITGFMGTGKSVVGREIARQKGWSFVDLDELIEDREKQIIARIFQEKGEPYFRALEKKALEEIAKKHNRVVSCGGGIVIDPGNIALMKKTGCIICLTATPEAILERTRTFTHRPLLNVPDPKAKIASLLKERQPFYSQADKTIDTSDLELQEVCRQALEFISRRH